MNQFNFKSQICTTREQSERLLSLGLKKKTADMKHIPYSNHSVPKCFEDGFGFEDSVYIPAWSLGRLLELAYGDIHPNNIVRISAHQPFEDMIKTIEGFIKYGCFNKEYLV